MLPPLGFVNGRPPVRVAGAMPKLAKFREKLPELKPDWLAAVIIFQE